VRKVELEHKVRYRVILVSKVLKERRVLKVLKERYKVTLVVRVLKDFKEVKGQMRVSFQSVLKVVLVLKVLKDFQVLMVKLLVRKAPKVL
jgi:hypothetical protein